MLEQSSFRSGNKLPLSKNQEQFWILHKLSKENPAYNLPSIFRIKGPLNIEALKMSIAKIVSKHEILRTNICEKNGLPWQIIKDFKDESFEIPLINLADHLTDNIIPEVVFQEIHRPFELESDSLLRIKLFSFQNNDHLLSIIFHHIIADFHSKELFSEELSLNYNSIVENVLHDSEKPFKQYSDFCLWQNEWLKNEEASRMSDEWVKDISKPDEILKLPVDFLPGKNLRTEGVRKHFVMDRFTSIQIRDFAKSQIVNPFTLLLTLYSIFINRLSGQPSIIIGVPFANRRKEEFKNTLGCFVNILPIQINFSDNSTFIGLLKQVRKALLMAHRKQEIPFLHLNSIIRQNNATALFQAGFAFEPLMELKLTELMISPVIIERKGLQLEVFLTIWEEGDCFHAFFEYSDQLYQEDTIMRFWKILSTIIQSALNESDTSIEDLNITPMEDIQFIKRLNNTNTPYEEDLCIHQKFEQQVKRNPEAVALLTKSHAMTYLELNEQANMLAHFLITKGVKNDDKIGICIDRSIEMIISIFGVLKAGAAYLPLNPDTPSERLKSIINDAGPILIITNSTSSVNIPEGFLLLNIDNIFISPLSVNTSNPDVKVSSKNLAYVIYTSGSTGIPKGVMIEHHSVMNRLGWMQKTYPIGETDILLQKTPITFDVSVWELFWWSFNGASLVLLPRGGEKEPETLIEYINDFNITAIHFVPSMFVSFLGVLKIRKLFNKIESLKRLFLSGEALSSKLVNDFNEERADHSLPDLINLYGPTEATVDVSYFNCPETGLRNVFIGKPIDNTRLFVVNDRDKIQPIGIPGELIISGVNLARGYLNHPELTNRNFFNLQTYGKEVVRAYRSGDIVKLTSEGELEYIGRRDNQVKIRGFRIELGDIESKIFEHTAVDNCAVVVADITGQKSLVAYIILKPMNYPEANILRDYLRKKIPEYMIPSYFVFLTVLPLTSTGKVDRKNLPAPDVTNPEKYIVTPKNKYEKQLFVLWKEILKIENISLYDNFFDIGGNSILAINLTSLIVRDFGIVVDTTAIFEYSNIKELSEYLTMGTKQSVFLDDSDIDEKTRRKKNINFKMKRVQRF